MENISTTYGVKSRWLRDDDPVFPCNAVSAADAHTCYQLVTSRILRVIGLDWGRTAQICSRVDKQWRRACFESLGRDIAAQTHRDPAQINALCAVARPYGGEGACISFAAMDLTANYRNGARASLICGTSPATTRRACYRAIGGILGNMKRTDTEREAACAAITGSARDIVECSRGASSSTLVKNVAR